ncbi:MAG: hypothetical protein RL308_1566 [Bacteroidota bacterium]|jgi:hypothetical protein
MKNKVVKYYIAAVYFCSTVVLYAQSPTAEDVLGTGNLEGDDTSTPINNYLVFLAIIGVLLVFMKFRALQSKVKA